MYKMILSILFSDKIGIFIFERPYCDYFAAIFMHFFAHNVDLHNMLGRP